MAVPWKRRWSIIATLSLFCIMELLALPGGAVRAEVDEGQATIPGGEQAALYLPWVGWTPSANKETDAPSLCPLTSARNYDLIPVVGPPADHPDEAHGDLNLSLRGAVATTADLTLIHVNGPTDSHAPQLYGLFHDQRTPRFTSAHRVYGWDWSCGAHGCRSAKLTPREVSLLGMEVETGETISIPSREPQIYAGAYKALVLYAAKERITVGYTREDSVAPGYAVHLEGICVDPNLLSLYREANGNGRRTLPALRNGEVLGTAGQGELRVAVRDRGTFMEPRSRKDWWKGR